MKVMKVLIVEDKPEEQECARGLVKDMVLLDVVYATTLTEALTLLDKGDIDIVITDVFYPIGQDPKSRKFFLTIGQGLLFANSAKFQDFAELSEYASKLCLGDVADEDIPSGIVLGLYALSKGVLSMFISSFEHHAYKTNALIALARMGVFEESLIEEGIDALTERKCWASTLYKYTTYVVPMENFSDDGNNYRKKIIASNKYGEEVKELLELPDKLHNYLEW